MSIATQSELDGLLRIGRIVGRILRSLADRVAPGVTTRELDETCAALLREQGARPTPADKLGFPGAACISVNDEAVHGVPGDRVIQPGDLVKLDLTADLDGFVADAARTVVVAPCAPQAAALEACARAAFEGGLARAQSGARVREIGKAVEREVEKRGFRVLRELVGHGVGRSVHEPPVVFNYDEPRSFDRLHEGLVITIEPIVSNGSRKVVEAGDGWTLRTEDGSLSAHFEETVVITRRGPIVATAV